MQLKRPIRTRFRYGYPPPVNLATHHNSQAHSSKGTPSRTTTPERTAEDALTACRHTVSGTISRPLTGALFTFPSRYWSAIGHQEVFRLTRWSWQIHTRLQESAATRDNAKQTHSFRLPDYHRLRCRFPTTSTSHRFSDCPTHCQMDQHAPT